MTPDQIVGGIAVAMVAAIAFGIWVAVKGAAK